MNQLSVVGFGNDATKVAGYAVSAGDRLGNIDLIFDNRGENPAYVIVKELVSGSYSSTLVPGFTVAAKGTITKSLVAFNKQVGFFGSGNTTVAISPNFRNPGGITGAQYDIVPVGKTSWTIDPGVNSAVL